LDVQQQLLSPQSGSQEDADDDRQTGFGRWPAKHRRPVILMGAMIMLATYFFRNVVSDQVKDETLKAGVGAVEYNLDSYAALLM
jgi:hypothetical protein